MPDLPIYIYWDANCFLHYINDTPEYINTLQGILSEVEQSEGKRKIVTSILSLVEVAHSGQELIDRTLDESALNNIDKLFYDSSVVLLVEFTPFIAKQARGIMRIGLEESLKRDPRDCIHLATATYMKVCEAHTYDKALWAYSDHLGINVCEPRAQNPRLF